MAKRKMISNYSSEIDGLATDAIRDVRKNKIVIPIILLGLVIAAAIFLFAVALPLRTTAVEAGSEIGSASGLTAGIAVGSVEGATIGAPEGIKEGIADGLSTEDTVVSISNMIEGNVNGLGKLEVLAANASLTTYHEVGEKYAALYLTRANVVFTVDLSEVTVTYKDGLISIALPKPTAEIKVDPSETERLAEWQASFFNVSDGDGFKAYLNTFKATKSYSEDEIENYSALLDMASESAVRQVTEIANVARGSNNGIAVAVSIQAA